MFCHTTSHKKKILMHKVAVCTLSLKLLIDLFDCFSTHYIAIFLYAFSLYSGFVLCVYNITHVLDLESLRFQTRIQLIILHIVLLLTCSISY